MNFKLAEQVLGDAKAAVDDVTNLTADVKASAHLRWRLLCAEFSVFKLGCGRLLILLPLIALLILIAAMSVSALIGYAVYLLTASVLIGILVVAGLQITALAFAGLKAVATLHAMNFARSRAHLLRLSRHVVG